MLLVQTPLMTSLRNTCLLLDHKHVLFSTKSFMVLAFVGRSVTLELIFVNIFQSIIPGVI